MIVRVSGEDQYRLGDADGKRVQELEDSVAAAVESGDERAFADAYDALLEHVRTTGERVGDDELEGSDVILPPADITLAEAAREFTGDGLIPD
jgi:PspA-Associated protein